MIYWLGSRGGTPWDRLGGTLPVNTMTAVTSSYCSYTRGKNSSSDYLNFDHPVMKTCEENTVCMCVCVPVDEDSSVVLGAERLDVAVAPLEPSPSTVLTGLAEE